MRNCYSSRHYNLGLNLPKRENISKQIHKYVYWMTVCDVVCSYANNILNIFYNNEKYHMNQYLHF